MKPVHFILAGVSLLILVAVLFVSYWLRNLSDENLPATLQWESLDYYAAEYRYITTMSANQTRTAIASLFMQPNLKIVTALYMTPACGEIWGVSVTVYNESPYDARAFTVEVNDIEKRISTLPARRSISIWVETSWQVNIFVDSGEEITESDETDNTLITQLPIPTLPVFCSYTPTG